MGIGIKLLNYWNIPIYPEVAALRLARLTGNGRPRIELALPRVRSIVESSAVGILLAFPSAHRWIGDAYRLNSRHLIQEEFSDWNVSCTHDVVIPTTHYRHEPLPSRIPATPCQAGKANQTEENFEEQFHLSSSGSSNFQRLLWSTGRDQLESASSSSSRFRLLQLPCFKSRNRSFHIPPRSKSIYRKVR